MMNYQEISEKFKVLEQKIRGHNWFSEINRQILFESLCGNLANLPNPKVLEIGCYKGRSTAYLMTIRPDIELHVIDTFEGSPEHGANEKENIYTHFEEGMKELGLFDKITNIVTGDSKDLPNLFEGHEFDLIYIDAAHEAEPVYHDVKNSLQLMKAPGIIVGDDWCWATVREGLFKALSETSPMCDHQPPLEFMGRGNCYKIIKYKK